MFSRTFTTRHAAPGAIGTKFLLNQTILRRFSGRPATITKTSEPRWNREQIWNRFGSKTGDDRLDLDLVQLLYKRSREQQKKNPTDLKARMNRVSDSVRYTAAFLMYGLITSLYLNHLWHHYVDKEADKDPTFEKEKRAYDTSAASAAVLAGTKVVGVTIPEGAMPGQQIVIQLRNGKKVGVQVPEGAVPGQQLQVGISENLINAPPAEEAGESGDDEGDLMTLPKEAALLCSASRKLRDGGKLADAEKLMTKALEVTEEAKGPAHPIVGLLVGHLGILLKAQGKFNEAELFFRRALVSELTLHGEKSAEVAPMMGHVASVLEEQGRFSDAISLYQKCFDLRSEHYGSEPHEAVASSLCALAGCQKNAGKITVAEANYRRAKDMCLEKLGAGHESVDIIDKTLKTFPKLKALARFGVSVDGQELNKADSPWSPLPPVPVAKEGGKAGQEEPKLELIAAEPFTAHEPSCLRNSPGSMEGKVCLVLRGGGSSFAEKVDRAHAAGAIAVLVVSNDEAHPKSVFQMGSSEGYIGPVPAVMIGYEDGMRLKAKLDAGAAPVLVEFRERDYQDDEDHHDEEEDGVMVPSEPGEKDKSLGEELDTQHELL